MLHWFIILSTFCGVSYYIAHSYPATYLRWEEAIAWSTHALSLGLIFGIGFIFGRYGFSKDAGGVIADWLIVYAPIVTCLYIAILLYHSFLCTIAEHRQRYSDVHIALSGLIPAFCTTRFRLAISALKRSPSS